MFNLTFKDNLVIISKKNNNDPFRKDTISLTIAEAKKLKQNKNIEKIIVKTDANLSISNIHFKTLNNDEAVYESYIKANNSLVLIIKENIEEIGIDEIQGNNKTIYLDKIVEKNKFLKKMHNIK